MRRTMDVYADNPQLHKQYTVSCKEQIEKFDWMVVNQIQRDKYWLWVWIT